MNEINNLINYVTAYSILTTEHAKFDYTNLATRYRIWICCSDDYSMAPSFVDVKVNYVSVPLKYTPPGNVSCFKNILKVGNKTGFKSIKTLNLRGGDIFGFEGKKVL